MEFGSEKDGLLKAALEEIMSVRIEGAIYNKDHLGYWSILNQNLINIAVSSFRTGMTEFYSAISLNDKKKELANYNLRVLTRLANSETVSLAAENVYQTFSNVILERQGLDIDYDMVVNGEIYVLTKFEKIFLLMHVYQDSLDTSYLMHYNEYLRQLAAANKGGRKRQ